MRRIMTQDNRAGEATAKVRRRELLTFLVLAFGIWPIVAVGVVGGYGFLVWMWQIVFGPPGPPAGGIH
jgi:nitrate reductase NapE